MPREKRGQLTLFVIIALVVVVGIIVYFFSQENFTSEQKYDPKVEILKANIQDCFKSTYTSSLEMIGIQGGYLEVPEPKTTIYVYFFSIDIPYYYYEGNLHTPTIEIIEEEIEKTVDQTLQRCLEKLDNETFESITFNEYKTKAKIKENEVTFTTDIDMTVNYDGKSAIVEFKKTPQTIPSDIYGMYEIATFIAESLKTNNEWIPYSEIVELSQEYDLYVSVTDDNDGTENGVLIQSAKEGYSPTTFNTLNKYGAMDFEEILPLL